MHMLGPKGPGTKGTIPSKSTVDWFVYACHVIILCVAFGPKQSKCVKEWI